MHHLDAGPIQTTATVVTGVLAVAFVIQWSYLQGLAAAMDPAGRVASILASSLFVGGALGPAVGGQLVEWGGYLAIGGLPLAAAALALILVVPVARRVERDEAARAGDAGAATARAQRSSR